MKDIINSKVYANEGNNDVLSFLTVPGDVLDLGCGAGDNAKKLKSRGFYVDSTSISITELNAALPFLKIRFLFDLETGLPPKVL